MELSALEGPLEEEAILLVVVLEAIGIPRGRGPTPRWDRQGPPMGLRRLRGPLPLHGLDHAPVE